MRPNIIIFNPDEMSGFAWTSRKSGSAHAFSGQNGRDGSRIVPKCILSESGLRTKPMQLFDGLISACKRAPDDGASSAGRGGNHFQ